MRMGTSGRMLISGRVVFRFGKQTGFDQSLEAVRPDDRLTAGDEILDHFCKINFQDSTANRRPAPRASAYEKPPGSTSRR